MMIIIKDDNIFFIYKTIYLLWQVFGMEVWNIWLFRECTKWSLSSALHQTFSFTLFFSFWIFSSYLIICLFAFHGCLWTIFIPCFLYFSSFLGVGEYLWYSCSWWWLISSCRSRVAHGFFVVFTFFLCLLLLTSEVFACRDKTSNLCWFIILGTVQDVIETNLFEIEVSI